MTLGTRRSLAACFFLCLFASFGRSAAAQAFGSEGAVFLGAEARSYSFRQQFAVSGVRQIAFPAGILIPVGRLSIDIGGYYAATTLQRLDGSSHTVSGPTDTQVRASYVIGRDAVVASVMVNLPTGLDRLDPTDFNVLGAVSSAFLVFPVNSYGNGSSVTGSLAGVLPVGSWNLGLAASIRRNGEFTPLVQTDIGPITYHSGVEGRVRAGVDRLVGSSRFALGVTYSTFGNDEFSGKSGLNQYRPGRRWIEEASLLAPFGRGTLTLFAWNYHRSAGDTTGAGQANAGNSESLFSAGGAASLPLGVGVHVEPGIEGRYWKPENSRGFLFGSFVALRVKLSDRLDLLPTVRYDVGYLDAGATRANAPNAANLGRHDLAGVSVSLFLRSSF